MPVRLLTFFLIIFTFFWIGCGGDNLKSSQDAVEDVEVQNNDVNQNVSSNCKIEGATSEQITACRTLNKVRNVLDLDPVKLSKILNKAAQKHADFVISHCKDYGKSGLSVHYEDPSYGDDFSGKTPFDRAGAQGYAGYGVGEVIAFMDDPERSVYGWLETLYHRLLILDPSAIEVGYGHASVHKACPYQLYRHIDVMDIGIGGGGKIGCFIYPYDDQKDVPVEFEGYESPQPPAPPNGYPSGPIITVQCIGKGWKWLSHEIIDTQTHSSLEHVAISNQPNEEAGVKSDPQAMPYMPVYLALYTYRPLKPDHTYQVRVTYSRGGAKTTLQATFTTASASAF